MMLKSAFLDPDSVLFHAFTWHPLLSLGPLERDPVCAQESMPRNQATFLNSSAVGNRKREGEGVPSSFTPTSVA